MKALALLDGGSDDAAVLDYLQGLSQRAQLSIEALVLNGAWAPPSEAVAVPELVVAGSHGLAMPPYRPPHTQNGPLQAAGHNGHAAVGEVTPLPAWLQPLLKGYAALNEYDMPSALLGRTPYADLVLMSRGYLRSHLLVQLERWSAGQLRAPILVPAPEAKLPKRVLAPAEISRARMLTPLRRYLYAGAQLVLYTCALGTEQPKQIVSYMQAHHEAPSYYSVDAMERRGLLPVLAPHTLLVVSLGAEAACESRVGSVLPLLEAPFSSWELSFLILP